MKEVKTPDFFSKRFNIINFLIQSGILLTIITFVFKSGTYFEQVSTILNNIQVMQKDIIDIKQNLHNLEYRVHDIEKDNKNMELRDEQIDKRINDVEKCQKNRKNC